VFLDVFLSTDTRNQPDLFIAKSLAALFEHVRVPDVEAIENTIRVDSLKVT
jgi:hypothetical protein